MSPSPAPLPSGTVLAERFVLDEAIGRGGFAIAYKARDLQRDDLCVVKELAPAGTARRPDLVLDLEHEGAVGAARLRARFLEEARLLQRFDMPGLPQVRATLTDFGTAYLVTQYIHGAQTLEELLARQGPMDANGALDLIYQLLETLEAIHSKGILHRDIKPSNVLISPKNEAYLIDLGAAREWHADATVHHTVLYTPGYAPLEQLSEKARRGPATDLYALCATAYRMLTGMVPPSPADRIAGAEVLSLRELRPDIEPSVVHAIEAGLALNYAERPQSVQALREMMSSFDDSGSMDSLDVLDEKLHRLQRFSFDRRACPSCGGLLHEVKPLKKGICPVCRTGLIRKRNLSPRLCPVCRTGVLHKRDNTAPLAFCPLCKTGELNVRRKSLLGKALAITCKKCETAFEADEEGMTQLPEGPRLSWDEWGARSGRSDEVHICDSCKAQFDTLQDGRRKQVTPEPGKHKALYPQEWARVAGRLEPFDGDAECDDCGADYAIEEDRISLLQFDHDPFGFGMAYRGRLITWEDARWLGVGKESPGPGLVCADCGTEFDHDGEYLRLVKTEDPKLVRFVDEPRTLEDWHRLGQGLPLIEHEDEFLAQFPAVIRQSYERGEISLHKGALWNGPAQRLDRDAATGTLFITPAEITFGGLLRKWRTPLDALLSVKAEGDVLSLQLTGEREDFVWELEPIEMTVHLKSGEQTVELNAENLAARLSSTALRGVEAERLAD